MAVPQGPVQITCEDLTELPKTLPDFKKDEFEDTCKRRFFFGLGFDPYGGVAGLYDLGPIGCQIKTNVIALWRKHFILEESMLEVDTTALTPFDVFKTSGHTDRFTDVMIRDKKTSQAVRADKYIEDWCKAKLTGKKEKLTDEKRAAITSLQARVDGMTKEEIAKVIEEFGIKSESGNDFTEPYDYNLMFPTPIGPEGDRTAFLRPELAQGILLNFKRLLEFNASRMPFAGACIGSAYRNEIAPRNNLIRVREFTLAEIEHFVNPNDKTHSKYPTIKDVKVWAFPKERQEAEEEPILMTIGEMVDQGMLKNETIAYFVARTKLFLQTLGVRYIRFRQHKDKELAHYAQDCWDAECLTGFGWVECVGIADRACYDLMRHAEARKVDMVAYEKFDEPRLEDVLERKVEKGLVNTTFKRDAKAVHEYIEGMSEEEALKLEEQLNAGDVEIEIPSGKVTLKREMVSFKKVQKKVEGRNYTPAVIEPSFGIGRIMYALLEQCYWVRREEGAEEEAKEEGGKKPKKSKKEDKNEKRAVFSLLANVAPYKCSILTLTPAVFREPWCQELIAKWRREFTQEAITFKVDEGSQTIGKKYARTDELGVPFGLTIDGKTNESSEVTLRERDSTKQVYIKVDEVSQVLSKLCSGQLTWEDCLKQFRLKTD